MRKRPDIHRYDDLRLTDEQALHLWRVLFPTAPFPTVMPIPSHSDSDRQEMFGGRLNTEMQ